MLWILCNVYCIVISWFAIIELFICINYFVIGMYPMNFVNVSWSNFYARNHGSAFDYRQSVNIACLSMIMIAIYCFKTSPRWRKHVRAHSYDLVDRLCMHETYVAYYVLSMVKTTPVVLQTQCLQNDLQTRTFCLSTSTPKQYSLSNE